MGGAHPFSPSLFGSAASAPPRASCIGGVPADEIRRFATYARGSAFPSLAVARGMADVGYRTGIGDGAWRLTRGRSDVAGAAGSAAIGSAAIGSAAIGSAA
ncbi:MAG TPA: hypothetical protein VIK41_13555, partial [Gemmatimonadaceae bacterium]